MKFLSPCLLLLIVSAPPAPAAEPKPVVDVSQLGADLLALPSPGDQVSVAPSPEGGLAVNIAPGPLNYPGITFNFAQDTLILDDCGYIELRVTNTSAAILSLNLRVDSIPSGDIPRGRSTGTAYLKPGESGRARAYFAHPPRGYEPVSPNHIKQILIYTNKSADTARSFRIEALEAAGEPGQTKEN
ncbi:MAG: hypothetical protein ABII82_19775 [Verrucomicrobiota bacterium]